MDQELEKMKKQVEYIFLKRIVTGLRDGSIEVAQAKAWAQAFLKIEPFANFDDAKAKLAQFAVENPLFEELKGYIEAYHYEQKVDAVIQKMRQHMGDNNLDEALKVAQDDT